MRHELASAALAASLAMLAPHAAQATAKYALAPQKIPAAQGTYEPVALTDYGLAVGTLLPPSGVSYAFYSEGKTWSADSFCAPISSNSTQVTGISRDSALTYTVGNCMNTARGFIYDQGSNVNTVVHYPGSTVTTMAGITLGGLAVGTWGAAGSPVHGFYLVGSIYVSFDVPGAATTLPQGINSQNTIFGNYTTAGGASHGFLLSQGGTYTTLNYPGAASTFITGLDGANQASGYYVDNSGLYHAFAWNNGTFQLPPLPAHGAAFAIDVNESGDVAGTYSDPGDADHGFVWNLATNKVIKINAKAGTSGLRVTAINNRDAQVTGTYFNSSGSVIGFIATCGGTSCF
jgi:hypothetical protein